MQSVMYPTHLEGRQFQARPTAGTGTSDLRPRARPPLHAQLQ